jgi:hypothetical protein
VRGHHSDSNHDRTEGELLKISKAMAASLQDAGVTTPIQVRVELFEYGDGLYHSSAFAAKM